MKDVKQILFEEAFYLWEKLKRYRRAFGEWDRMTMTAEETYRVAYDIVVYAGLEDEYLAWRDRKEEANV